ncbi:F0F1 ATP synthase subunit B [Caldisalinibacter kiritimatiensis]|uniref:ATP synthase subunit b n=1 Tax=Caldisalinibacter kiritimatiensis TaxID=1304284 RepID=R1CL79_9FIRM|nr:F0F1 ATP synthase subunit B [Caldisalinibacter kiritimatiensis]EOC99450.1 ATP synthase B chain [Caldisalinibacter kiritimatiensis]
MPIEVRVIPDLLSVGLQWAATLVLFIVLRHFLFEPVSKFLNERRERIEGDLTEAKKEKEEAVKLKEEYQLKIEEAKQEAQSIIETGKKRAGEVREEIIADAKKEAENIVERANREIVRQREKAMEELKSEVVTIAMMAASKVVDKDLDEKSHREMINKFIDEVGESKWQN